MNFILVSFPFSILDADCLEWIFSSMEEIKFPPWTFQSINRQIRPRGKNSRFRETKQILIPHDISTFMIFFLRVTISTSGPIYAQFCLSCFSLRRMLLSVNLKVRLSHSLIYFFIISFFFSFLSSFLPF